MTKKVLIVSGIVLGVIALSVGIVMLENNQARTGLVGEVGPGKYSAPGSLGVPDLGFSNPLGKDFKSRAQDSVENEIYSETVPSETFSAPLPQAEKKVIKTGNLFLKVDSAERASREIGEIARSNGGEVFSSNFFQGSGKNVKNGNVTVKVPVGNFEKAYSEIKKVANLVVRESTSGQDVTEEFVDLEAQLKNKKVEEEAFLKIMEKAEKIQDILDVQTELSRVRGEIEMLEGRKKFLSSQTDMSTIVVSLSEDAVISVTDKWRPLQVAKESVSVLIKKIQDFADFLIRLIILVVPIFVLYAVLVFVLYLIGRGIYNKFRKQ